MAEPTIQSASEQLRNRQISARELTEFCLARIDRHEDRVRAWVMVDAAGARAAADRCDGALRRGESLGPWHGIPLGIKDIIDVAGWPTLAGSPLRTGHVAAADAEVVARLKRCGAVLLGKTVTTQFASFDPPPTRNPWDLSRTPGGSSSGSAAAVSLGMCLGALGSQTGGSITRPASYCGTAGCKPSYGLASLRGIVPLAHHLDHPGPIARTVADLRTLLASIADLPPANVAQPGPLRVGWLKGFFWNTAADGVREAVGVAVNRLRSAGHSVEPCVIDADMPQVIARHRRIMAVEAAEYHRPWFPSRRQDYGPCLAALLDEGHACGVLDYAAAVREQATFQRQALAAMAPFDCLLLPATVDTAPDAATTGNPSFNSPWSYSGLPVVSFPCGLADGLPVCLQLVGRPLNDAGLLSLAERCEQTLGFNSLPSLLAT